MYSSKNVLLVSPYPYSISSRGMDVLTKSFDDEGWNVTHLTFPKAFYTPKVTKPENSKVNTIEARNSIFPYIDRIMFWFPKLLFDIVKWFNNRTVKNIDFSQYDYIVLESGKALFLMDLIPENVPIIYRLSDSVQLVLGKNKYYKELENIIFERSFKMIFKKEVYKNFLNDIEKNKTTVIENGMVIPKEIHSGNTYPDGSINAVYVGLHQLDFLTVSSLVRECSNCDFHIIGPCLSKKQVGKLEINKNFHYYPFLSKEEYMPLVKDATLAIFPFRRTESMKWFGLTSCDLGYISL
ncbi:MAG: hypothetical protein B6229_07330 [Spirochaetaceae bacterium 4572_7]|nr:MAG: hypothetical protein B6229_07330 [Spirochaetaceae bacterium 4572_7]